MTPTRLILDHIGKRWGSFVALSDIRLDVPRGMFLSLLGPSGCGKTTLLRVIVGALTPDGGRVMVDGSDVTRLPTHRRNMGMVFQSFALFPHLSVAENVDFPLSVRGLSRAERQQRVTDALRMVHLDMLAERYPRELSGGQQQRVGLARAIVYRPTILLLDEPLSNLDASLREEMRIEISQVTRQLDITAVYVTHDQREALALSDAIAVMNRGQVVQFGTPEEIYRFPRNDFIAHFVGYANALPVVIADGCARIEAVGTVLQADIAGLSGPATAFIHAGAIVLEPAGAVGANRLDCAVADIAFMGDHVEYVLRHPAGLQLKAQVPVGTLTHPRGTAVSVLLAPDKLIIVPRETAPA
ncbi:MAG TPA: ABC transporter ATP-binding protein [Acetobacteraceae bacterium]